MKQKDFHLLAITTVYQMGEKRPHAQPADILIANARTVGRLKKTQSKRKATLTEQWTKSALAVTAGNTRKNAAIVEKPYTRLSKLHIFMWMILIEALRIKNTKKESKKIGKYPYCQTDAFKNQRPFGCNCLMKKGRAGT